MWRNEEERRGGGITSRNEGKGRRREKGRWNEDNEVSKGRDEEEQ